MLNPQKFWVLTRTTDVRPPTTDTEAYRPRTKAVGIAATRLASALAARSLTLSKPLQRAASSTASTVNADEWKRDQITDGAPRPSGQAHGGDKLQPEIVGDKAHGTAKMPSPRVTHDGDLT